MSLLNTAAPSLIRTSIYHAGLVLRRIMKTVYRLTNILLISVCLLYHQIIVCCDRSWFHKNNYTFYFIRSLKYLHFTFNFVINIIFYPSLYSVILLFIIWLLFHSLQVKSSKSGLHTNTKPDKTDSVILTKSKSVTDIPSGSYPYKEKDRSSRIPIIKTRKHKIDQEHAPSIEFEYKIKRNSSKYNLEPIHNIDNLEIQYTKKNHQQQPSTSTSSHLSAEIGNKHKSRKDKKSSRSPSSSKSKIEEYKPKERSKEDQKPRDKSKEDKIHTNSKNNLNNSRSDISFKEKSKKSNRKDRDYSSFNLRYSSSVDNLDASTSTGNLTYPQVTF